MIVSCPCSQHVYTLQDTLEVLILWKLEKWSHTHHVQPANAVFEAHFKFHSEEAGLVLHIGASYVLHWTSSFDGHYLHVQLHWVISGTSYSILECHAYLFMLRDSLLRMDQLLLSQNWPNMVQLGSCTLRLFSSLEPAELRFINKVWGPLELQSCCIKISNILYSQLCLCSHLYMQRKGCIVVHVRHVATPRCQLFSIFR
jgi:hypothetical protein